MPRAFVRYLSDVAARSARHREAIGLAVYALHTFHLRGMPVCCYIHGTLSTNAADGFAT